MSVKTKDALKSDFSDNQTATGVKFADLIDSLKAIQEAVSDPSANGKSITFIATFTQDENGKAVVTKKTVDFSGYQTVSDMAGYQKLDLQKVGNVTAAAGGSQIINHKMKHFPTVRLIDGGNMEVKPSEYSVKQTDNENVEIILGGSLTGSYRYILD